MKECWVPIKGFEFLYEISSFGKVRSLTTGKLIKSFTSKGTRGYVNVYLYNGHNKKVTKKLHRLLAEAFIINPDNKQEVNHIDSNRSNNSLDNLEWVTPKENVRHSWDNNRCTRLKGELNGCSKLTDSEVKEIKKELCLGVKGAILSKRYKVSPQVISRIKLNQRKVNGS